MRTTDLTRVCFVTIFLATLELAVPAGPALGAERVERVGDIDVQDVRYEHGERFIQYRLTRNLAAGTTTKKVKQLKRVFQPAEDRGPLDRHPPRRLKPPRAPRRKIRVFTESECRSLCRAARQREEKGSPVKWALLIRMCLGTGMRRGQLMNATW
jgi:integrase